MVFDESEEKGNQSHQKINKSERQEKGSLKIEGAKQDIFGETKKGGNASGNKKRKGELIIIFGLYYILYTVKLINFFCSRRLPDTND